VTGSIVAFALVLGVVATAWGLELTVDTAKAADITEIETMYHLAILRHVALNVVHT